MFNWMDLTIDEDEYEEVIVSRQEFYANDTMFAKDIVSTIPLTDEYVVRVKKKPKTDLKEKSVEQTYAHDKVLVEVPKAPAKPLTRVEKMKAELLRMRAIGRRL